MKREITKEAFDKLSDALKAEYEAKGDLYILKLEDYEDPGELRRARDREKQSAQEAKAEQQRLQKELDKIQNEIDEAKTTGHAKKGDIAALEQSWKEKNLKLEESLNGKVQKRDSFIRKTLRDNVAFQIAERISESPRLLLPHILSRLDVDFEGGDDPTTRVLDAAGKPSALTVQELEAEFVANKEFASIIRGSKATGGGASGGNSSGGAAKKPSDMSEKERIELYKSDPASFAKMFPAYI